MPKRTDIKKILIIPSEAKTKTKCRMALLEEVSLKQVAPDEQEFLLKTEQLKRMLLKKVHREEGEF